MTLSKKSQKIVLLGSIAIVVVLLITATNLNVTSLAGDYETGIPDSLLNYRKTVSVTWRDNPLIGCYWMGQQCPGTDYPYKELITDDKYITSFMTTGLDAYSERIGICGNVFESSAVEVYHPDKGFYRVYLTEDGTNWEKIIDLNMVDTTTVVVVGGVGYKTCNYNPLTWWEDAQEVWMAAIEIRLLGPHVGALKVEACYHFTDGQTRIMATDYAYLISGSGDINIKGYAPYEIPMFENGETVTIQVNADYSGKTAEGTGRWELWAYPLREDSGGGRLIKSWSYDNFREDVNWKLPADAWIRGTNNSRWRLELHNTLFSTYAVDINTIDLRANAPPTPTISITPKQVIQGAVITLNISGNTNKLTNESLLYYAVILRYISASSPFIDKNVVVPPGSTDPYPVITTFIAPNPGQLSILVIAHDAAGRESEIPAKLIVTAAPEGTNPTPPIIFGDIEIIILILLILLVIGGVGLYIYQKRGFKLPKWGRKK